MSSKDRSLPFKKGLVVVEERIKSAPPKPEQPEQKKRSGLGLPEPKVVETTAEKEAQVRRDDAEIQNWRSKLSSTMPANLSLAWNLWAKDDDEVPQSFRVKKFLDVVAEVKEKLEVENIEARQVAVAEYADAIVRVKEAPDTVQALRAIMNGLEIGKAKLPGLIKLGIFVRTGKDNDKAIRVEECQFFAPVPESVDNLQEVVNLLSAKATKVFTDQMIREEEERERLFSQGKALFTIVDGKRESVAELPSVTELLSGKPGWFVLDVPWKGSALLLSDGQTVEVINAIGHFQNKVLGIKEIKQTSERLEVKLPVEALNTPRLGSLKLPRITGKGVFERVLDDFRELHTMLRRGVVAATEKSERKQKNQDERKRLQSMADTDFQIWFPDGVEGTTYAFLKTWTHEGKDFYPVELVLERRSDGWIRVVDYSHSLKDLLGDSYSEWMDPKERFGGIPNPLGNMLRKFWAIARGVRNRQQREQQQVAAPQSESGVQSEPTNAEQPAEQQLTSTDSLQQSQS